MPSERTFFNKAIYKRALSRFWIIGAAYAVVLCFLTLMCGQYFNSEFTEMSEYVSYSILSNLATGEVIDIRAFSAFCGMDSSNQVPDGDIGRFHALLVEHGMSCSRSCLRRWLNCSRPKG